MASTIKLKNGSGAPLAADLVQGEPALDLTNKRLYTEDSGGTVIEIGTNPSSLTTSSVDINGGAIDGTVIGGSSAAAGTFTTVTASVVDSIYYNEGVYNLTGTAINPANGSIQYKTLAANTTFTESLADGDSVTLRISGGATYTVTWPTMTWVTSAGNTAPTLTAGDVVVLWQEGTTVYGAYVGSYA
jgi:hypothetical protein